MQHNYEYLKDSSEALFNLTLVDGKEFNFSLDYSAIYEDLRTIEDNYRLLIRLDILLRDPKSTNLSDIELKVGLRSCAHAIVQAVCRVLEIPSRRSQKKTNCIYTRIHRDIKCENTKKRALIRHQKLVTQSWYKSLRTIRDKRLSHQEGYFDTYSVKMIGEFLSKPEAMQNLINAIKELLEFCASATLNGGRARYNPREYI